MSGFYSSFALVLFETRVDLFVAMGNPHEHTQDLLVFHLNGLGCALPPEAGQEIVPMASLIVFRGTLLQIVHPVPNLVPCKPS
jgi:hypothetical protein